MYRLRQLIYEKYGEEKFALGCEIVARWVRFDTKENWTAITVANLCNYKEESGLSQLSIPAAKSLQVLFGLKSIVEIYTVPEQSLLNHQNY